MLTKSIRETQPFHRYFYTGNKVYIILLFCLLSSGISFLASAQKTPVQVPDWALPGSATHKQVPPPLDFHRQARTDNTPIGIFEGQSDVGAALVPGSSSYNKATGQYIINSAGYNIWYTRD